MKRFIIILIALISSTLAFNQAVKAQNRIKVPVFESVVTAKNGSVNIRKEASTKSDKIGKIYANRRFYPLLEETDEWYCILLPATEDESQKKDGLVRCGYVSKTYSKAIAIDENLKDLSNLANYLETKMDCKESKRMEGDYRNNLIVSGTFSKYFNEEGRCVAIEEGRFIGIPHNGIITGMYTDKMDITTYILGHNFADLDKLEDIYGTMSSDQDESSNPKNNILTDEQIAKSLKFANNAIMYVVPHSFDSKKDWPGGENKDFDNKGVEVMYVDMEKYPFKTETIQFNDDESFSYFIVTEEEELERQKQFENEIKNMDEIAE